MIIPLIKLQLDRPYLSESSLSTDFKVWRGDDVRMTMVYVNGMKTYTQVQCV